MPKNTSPQVLQELTDRIGQVVYRDDIAQSTGLSPTQVKAAVYNLRSKSADLARSIQVISAGNAWRYRPNFETTPAESAGKSTKKVVRMFEEIADLGDGSIVLRCEDGTLYKALELKTGDGN